MTVAAVALIILGALLLSATAFAGADPKDPGLGDVAIFLSPILAAASGLVIGLVLLILAAFRMINLTLLGAFAATVVGLLVSPVAYLLVGYWAAKALTGLVAPMPILVDGLLTFTLPVVCGVGVSLYVAWRLRRDHTSGDIPER